MVFEFTVLIESSAIFSPKAAKDQPRVHSADREGPRLGFYQSASAWIWTCCVWLTNVNRLRWSLDETLGFPRPMVHPWASTWMHLMGRRWSSVPSRHQSKYLSVDVSRDPSSHNLVWSLCCDRSDGAGAFATQSNLDAGQNGLHCYKSGSMWSVSSESAAVFQSLQWGAYNEQQEDEDMMLQPTSQHISPLLRLS